MKRHGEKGEDYWLAVDYSVSCLLWAEKHVMDNPSNGYSRHSGESLQFFYYTKIAV